MTFLCYTIQKGQTFEVYSTDDPLHKVFLKKVKKSPEVNKFMIEQHQVSKYIKNV